MAARPVIMKLAKKISIESMTYTGIKETDPEYRILDPVVTDEMAEVGLGLKVRKYLTTPEVAKSVGKPVECFAPNSCGNSPTPASARSRSAPTAWIPGSSPFGSPASWSAW